MVRLTMKKTASAMTRSYSTSLDNVKGESSWFDIVGANVPKIDSAEVEEF